jgi:hypothetical protein
MFLPVFRIHFYFVCAFGFGSRNAKIIQNNPQKVKNIEKIIDVVFGGLGASFEAW